MSIDPVLEVLSDGEYHTFEEIMAGLKTTQLNEAQVECILSFLEDYNFIKRLRKRWSTLTWKAQLDYSVVRFLRGLKDLETTDEAQQG